ncbi:MAG: serine/threonine protein kinase [Lachnospiraceae bacterium]|nr:serine/threonine protein kinase [Lachnospiraceae bacterium]
MTYTWTKEEIESILLQLDEQNLPFKGYRFSDLGQGMKLLGTGGYAAVYAAQTRKTQNEQYAIKVIGFGDKRVDSAEFRESSEAQNDVGYWHNNIVTLYRYIELRVWLDEQGRIIRTEEVTEENEAYVEGDYLQLQFILMEKVTPVLTMDKSGKYQLYPPRLAAFDEAEILALAYHIGVGLEQVHNKNLLHRDIKLENIFFDEQKRCYKLGDFGIAKVTEDGMASTTAFTKGYGAPEVVGSLEDKYDNTADIYSFGMLLYVLLNGLKFPDSDNYNVNVKEQYQQGYLLPYPEYGSEEFCQVIGGMCRYDPDERYQSMEDVLNDLEAITVNTGVRFKKQHKHLSFVIGTISLFIGTVVWKLAFMPTLPVELNVWMYIFLGLAATKGILKIMKESGSFLDDILCFGGIILVIATGFKWWKLILVLCIAGSTGTFAGVCAGVVLLLNFTYLLTQYQPAVLAAGTLADMKWIAILLLSWAMFMFLQIFLLSYRDQLVMNMYFKKNLYWVCIILIYVALIAYGWAFSQRYNILLDAILSRPDIKAVDDWGLIKVGVAGVILSLVWIVREKVLVYLEERAGGD